MGREIRRVPKDWEHPKNDAGNFIPLYDESYKQASEAWMKDLNDFENDVDGDKTTALKEYKTEFYWDWNGPPPNKQSYRPEFISKPACYQIYENVSEGTPVSPVFETETKMIEWLIEKGYTEKSAKEFVKMGHAFSMMFSPSTGMVPGIQAYDLEAVKKGEMDKDFKI